MTMSWLKIGALVSDALALVTAGFALAHMASSAVQPPLDTLLTDAEAFITGPSFDAGNVLVTDAKAVVTAAETALGSGTMEVTAFKSALAALELELAA